MLDSLISRSTISKPFSIQVARPGRITLSRSLHRPLGRQPLQGHIMSTVSRSNKEPIAPGTLLKSDTRRMYNVEEILADRRQPLLHVYRARCVIITSSYRQRLTGWREALKEGSIS